MKAKLILLLLFAMKIDSAVSQNTGILILDESILYGEVDHAYFKGFKIELDSSYYELDSLLLFDQLPRIGHINFKNKVEIPTQFTLTTRAGYPQIMFRFRSDYLTFDNLVISTNKISFTIDDDPIVPVTSQDIEIIQLTKNILSDESYWNKEDDRNCDDDIGNKKYSIYCAIRIASLQIENKYNHRNATLQKLRHLVDENYSENNFNHRLMDFNNMDDLSYKELMSMLNEIEACFENQLKTVTKNR